MDIHAIRITEQHGLFGSLAMCVGTSERCQAGKARREFAKFALHRVVRPTSRLLGLGLHERVFVRKHLEDVVFAEQVRSLYSHRREIR